MIHSFYQQFLLILFPLSCYGCGKSGNPLCHICIRTARKSIAPLPPYITTLFSYQDPLIKKSLHAIKYYHRKDLLPPLVDALLKEMKHSAYEVHTNTHLVPIPMPNIRKYIRGYNQAELIATLLSQELHIPVNTHILQRTRTTSRQVTMKNKSSRLKNQKHSFIVHKAVSLDLSRVDIILVDDVTTTGATLDEARVTLLNAGARSVRAITLAH